MAQVRALVEALRDRVSREVGQAKTKAGRDIDERWERLAGMAEFGDLSAERQAQLRAPFDELRRLIDRQTLVAVIRDTIRTFDERGYQDALRDMAQWSHQAREPEPAGDADDESLKAIIEPPVEWVTRNALRVSYDKAWLADEQDVEGYLAALRRSLLEAIRAGKRVQV